MERWYRIIRKEIYHLTFKELELLEGEVEMDETLFGGRRPGKRDWGALGKQMVFGIYQRKGKVLTFPISSRSRDSLLPLITQHIKPGSLYYTDDWIAYASLSISGNHVVVPKEKGIARGRDHLNGVEGFWSYAKHWLYQRSPIDSIGEVLTKTPSTFTLRRSSGASTIATKISFHL